MRSSAKRPILKAGFLQIKLVVSGDLKFLLFAHKFFFVLFQQTSFKAEISIRFYFITVSSFKNNVHV